MRTEKATSNGLQVNDVFDEFDPSPDSDVPLNITEPTKRQVEKEEEEAKQTALTASRLRKLTVTLPAGGTLTLFAPEEVSMFDKTVDHYVSTYDLTEHNDLFAVGQIALLQVTLYRSQQAINNRVPEFDKNGDPLGRYISKATSADRVKQLHKEIRDTLAEVRAAEKALGVDKAKRDAGGAQNVAEYLRTAKAAARAYGLHLSERLKAYEAFNMELRMKLRILFTADDEDKRYHAITPDTICDWANEELKKLEKIDQEYAKEKGRIFVGRMI